MFFTTEEIKIHQDWQRDPRSSTASFTEQTMHSGCAHKHGSIIDVPPTLVLVTIGAIGIV
jgi:hypothetical protein